MFKVYFDYTQYMFQLLGFDVKEVVIVAGMRSEKAHEREDIHTVAKNTGASLVAEQFSE
jgi:hypothetical protein